MLQQIYDLIDANYDDMVKIRRYLHQHPELSFKEFNTAKYIANFYENIGIPFEKNVGGNGIIAKLEGNLPGKTVALRADFDALPIQDEKDVPYKSTVPGVMHACGHDGHTATLLILATIMKDFKKSLSGTIIFLHQHAEELAPGGAKPIIESGALNEVDAYFGNHLWATAPLGHIQTRKDVFMAGADRFEITIQGKGGHGAYPHETKDAIVIGCNIVNQLQQIISRRLSPLETAVITVGEFEAGTAFNIISDSARLNGTVRYLNPKLQHKIKTEMERILDGICASFDATCQFEYRPGYPPVINHKSEAELILDVAHDLEDVRRVEEVEPQMAGEDFSYYLLDKPGAFFFTGAKIENNVYPHHHPKFDFDERAMPIAAKVLISAYFKYQRNIK